ncbi:MAG: hypothetical protein KDK91_13695 [Gammaproteobacteria bacterium]|nr:hypothetical protein [Gammaproteobacteria bacterium]
MQHFASRLFTRWPLLALGVFALVWLATGLMLFLIAGVLLALVVAFALHSLPGAASGRRAAQLVERVDERMLAAMRARLRSVSARLGGSTIALEAIGQLDNANQRLVGFVEVLERRFDPKELTFGRYRAAAEQVYLSVIDGLDALCTNLESVADVDVTQLKSDLRRLSREQGNGDSVHDEARGAAHSPKQQALQAQLDLHQQQLDAARGIMASNETALAELTASAAKLARVDTGRGLASSEAEAAVGDLVRLADQAGRYASPERG